jgi:hypothetical protein
MNCHLHETIKKLVQESIEDPDNIPQGDEIISLLEDAIKAERRYDKTMAVSISAIVVSSLQPIWTVQNIPLACDDFECISPRAIVQTWLASGHAYEEETLEAHMARRKDWGHGDSFEDNFTAFEIANCTTVTYFDMDNEIVILVARNADHVDG